MFQDIKKIRAVKKNIWNLKYSYCFFRSLCGIKKLKKGFEGWSPAFLITEATKGYSFPFPTGYLRGESFYSSCRRMHFRIWKRQNMGRKAFLGCRTRNAMGWWLREMKDEPQHIKMLAAFFLIHGGKMRAGAVNTWFCWVLVKSVISTRTKYSRTDKFRPAAFIYAVVSELRPTSVFPLFFPNNSYSTSRSYPYIRLFYSFCLSAKTIQRRRSKPAAPW